MRNKRGQLDLSFGMIFSIILIIAFLGFGVYAIVKFIGMKDNVQTANFLEGLQEDVDVFWKSTQSTDDFTYPLPTKIKEICFIDANKGGKGNISKYNELEKYSKKNLNLVFYPIGSSKLMNSAQIEHIDISNITKTKNPICFENKKGKVTLTLKQEYGGTNLVMIQ